LGKKRRKSDLELTINIQRKQNDFFKMKEASEAHILKIAKVGKKKYWTGGEDGWGMAVRACGGRRRLGRARAR
jgi:retrograde regulation protein 2